MSQDERLTSEEIEALVDDADATDRYRGIPLDEMAAEPDELSVRAQEPEDKS